MTSPGDRAPLPVRVTEACYEAEAVRSLVLRRTSGAALPNWKPGAHIDVVLPEGAARQYSLCGDPDDHSAFRIAVLREPDGRGGSRWIHDEVAVGDVLRIRPPRNNFALESASAYTFVAGGIGITPILPMVKALGRTDTPWRLVYGGRNRSSMAFLDGVSQAGDRVTILAEDESGMPDIVRVVDRLHDGELIYVYGPGALVGAVKAAADAAGVPDQVRFELFTAPVLEETQSEAGPSFEVELRRSGLVVTVPAASSILSVVRAAGIEVNSDCEDGICGSCETAILHGRAEHRDQVLTLDEQRENTCMMICVSRSLDDRIVLDL